LFFLVQTKFNIMASPPDALVKRFIDTLDTPSFSDPDANLTYAERQQLKDQNYAALAREQLPHVERQLWWLRVNIGAGIALLVVMAVFLALHILDVVTASPEDLVFPLFYACCMGVAAAGSAWKYAALEKKRLLFELMIATEGDESASEVHREEAFAAMEATQSQ
jgi:hypothetical protein